MTQAEKEKPFFNVEDVKACVFRAGCRLRTVEAVFDGKCRPLTASTQHFFRRNLIWR